MATKKITKPEDEEQKTEETSPSSIVSPPTPQKRGKVSTSEKAKASAAKKTISTSEKAKVGAAVKAAKSPLDARGKKYRKVYELIDRAQAYDLEAGIELAKKTATTKFDSSVDLHVNLGVDPTQSDQIVRTSLTLPGGSPKSLKVKVIKTGAEGEKAMAEIEKGKLDFDILVTTPDMMPKLAKLAKVLGPKGLMPNPKSGTVTPDPDKAVKEIQGGKVELRIDKQAIIHQSIGKVSFADKNLTDNAKAVISAIQTAKPSGVKGTYIQAITLATSMGPSVKLDTQKILTELHK